MARKFIVHAALVCDDVRPELSGKTTLVGVYDEAIIFGTFPAALQKLVFWLSITLLDQAEEFRLDIHSPDFNIDGMVRQLPFHSKGDRGNLVFELNSLIFSREQDFKISIAINGQSETVLKFAVRLAASEAEKQVISRISAAT